MPSKDHGVGKRWQVRYRVNGHQKKESYTRRPQADARAAEVETDLNRGQYVDRSLGKEMVAVYAARWFEHLDRVHERPATVSTYKTHMRVYVVPYFRNMPARSLRRQDSNAFVASLIAKDLAPSYVQAIYKTYRIFVHWLMDDEEVPLPGNAVSRVKLPPVAPRVEVVLSPDEVQRLADCIEPRYEIMVWLAALAGLRLGECCGLTVERVNFLENKLYLERQRQAGREAQLKTQASYATLPVDPLLIKYISQHLLLFPGAAPVGPDAARKRRARGYVEPETHGLVVVNRDGRPVQRQTFNKVWNDAVRKAGLPKGTRFHDLKHFYTSRLHAAGHDRKTVQALSRHSEERTNAIYSHPPEAVEGLRVRAFSKLFARERPGKAVG
ncbi:MULTISPECIES: tyrosine-type recombinase/integrase [Streptomyces]|uniref:tyrosine-type recombinase/integrase n=1 Tax=Streptomyces TaxID=1883 RepID=UPI001B358D46|nr:site-specific integrase [Streptomyces sp. RK75]MBQ0863386.1 site-specific integrase [Streptomyces sp. RK75]